ncbi:MAG: ATP-dependent zinc protease [Gammaproteobacteria bacterium]|nr:ATP-dependent zinc protease [Gammaproteobacteria bacterium]
MTDILGWREWLAMPELGIEKIKAKIDTGARTSAIHAFDVQLDESSEKKYVKFKMHPSQDDLDYVVECSAPLLDEREVRDSGGHTEMRYVIETSIHLGEKIITAEVTLTNRDSMGFRMLIGRTAIKGIYLVDPGGSYLVSQKLRHSS